MVSTESIKLLEDLHRLKADGIITDEEFTKSKEDILSGISGGKEAVRVAAIEPGARPTQAGSGDDVFAWMFLPFSKYADFTGRASRKEFWLFQIPFFIVLALTFIIPIFALAGLAFLIPYIAVTARRFHDQGMSGWFTLLNLIPYIGWIIVFGFMLVPSDAGENRFGPHPLSP